MMVVGWSAPVCQIWATSNQSYTTCQAFEAAVITVFKLYFSFCTTIVLYIVKCTYCKSLWINVLSVEMEYWESLTTIGLLKSKL